MVKLELNGHVKNIVQAIAAHNKKTPQEMVEQLIQDYLLHDMDKDVAQKILNDMQPRYYVVSCPVVIDADASNKVHYVSYEEEKAKAHAKKLEKQNPELVFWVDNGKNGIELTTLEQWAADNNVKVD